MDITEDSSMTLSVLQIMLSPFKPYLALRLDFDDYVTSAPVWQYSPRISKRSYQSKHGCLLGKHFSRVANISRHVNNFLCPCQAAA